MDFINDFIADTEFRKLLEHRDDQIDLTTAALELARDAYPDLPFAPITDWIAARAAELSGPIARAGSDEALLGELAACLAGRHGLTGSTESFDSADGSFLNRVIERKTGLPISLSILYMAVAGRAGIELHGVGAPAHFLTRYDTFDEPLFVDAFAGGSILTADECVNKIVAAQKLPEEQVRRALEPIGSRLIIIRMLNNLKTLYARFEDWRPCWKVQHRLLALMPAAHAERRDWAVIALKAGRSAAALEMFESCLRTCPADEKPFFEKQLQEARGKLAQWN
jgi:regulator of sirC expression with transglutaminase-like and TPR domain